MALPLHERAVDGQSEALVRLTGNGLEIERPASCLVPGRKPAAGEQYRFHFNMTKCIGCRSCEVACNEQNGNPAEILWRRIGELEGGVYPHTSRYYLSMGCNHCLDADCLRGCPVNAYTKDAATGIVVHSADICIGCSYCIWNCPYSVPQFNPERGVVGKCDMCKNRLEEGREPACANACPEGAIEIEIVNMAQWRQDFAAAESPGLPPAAQTVSTTRITLPEDTTTSLEPVDANRIHLEHSHLPLVYMTALMQAVSGAVWVLLLRHGLSALRLAILLGITALALTLSTLHLGRPAYAWRALKMWRRSWLSREVMLFTLFIHALAGATLGTALGLPHAMVAALDWATAGLGLLGTVASAAIYLVRARPAWNTAHTPLDFLLTAALLGSLLAVAMQAGPRDLALVIVAAAAWLINQTLRSIRLHESQVSEAAAAFGLMTRLTPLVTAALLLLALCIACTAVRFPLTALACGLASVLLARYLFFVTVVPRNMALTFVRARHA